MTAYKCKHEKTETVGQQSCAWPYDFVEWCKTCGATRSVAGGISKGDTAYKKFNTKWRAPQIAKDPDKFAMWCEVCNMTYSQYLIIGHCGCE